MPKRRRTEEPAIGVAGSSTTPKHSEKVWYDDGNIIIQAGNLQFKIHKGVLTKQSTVFADLFQIPHPVDEPTLDGCPIVEVHDSAEDVEHALLAVYGDPEHLGTTGKPTLPALIGMIRLGKKYELTHVRDVGLAQLKKEFPESLEDCDRILDSPGSPNFLFLPHSDDIIEQFLEVIKLAHECSIQSILPVVYLRVAGYDLNELLSHPALFSLPQEAHRSILCGREKLLQARKDWLSSLRLGGECRSEARCALLIYVVMKQLLSEHADPLAVLRLQWAKKELQQGRAILPGQSDGKSNDLCRECVKEFRKGHAEGRRTTWDELPAYFNLPKWNELNDFEV
ncbi:hypothetical protein NMY22_g7579 [Coprinellus aureogranulatus]|nr:hypothetical protein NMY22_g7579 [Coprinellus aureogranulatus]